MGSEGSKVRQHKNCNHRHSHAHGQTCCSHKYATKVRFATPQMPSRGGESFARAHRSRPVGGRPCRQPDRLGHTHTHTHSQNKHNHFGTSQLSECDSGSRRCRDAHPEWRNAVDSLSFTPLSGVYVYTDGWSVRPVGDFCESSSRIGWATHQMVMVCVMKSSLLLCGLVLGALSLFQAGNESEQRFVVVPAGTLEEEAR